MLENVILPTELKEELVESIKQIKCIHKIYTEWGFKDIDNNPRVVLNFHGPSGTGKTLAAEEIAKYFKLAIIHANPADVNSKYVGISEKIVVDLFKRAKDSGSILFFDEADCLLRARSNSSESGSLRSSNNIVTTILTELETHTGIVIFATNLLKNYDPAFEARIAKHLHFPLPLLKARIGIINKLIPTKAPLEEGFRNEDNIVELALLCEGFSGRHIKNAVLNLLTNAAVNHKEVITMELAMEVFEKAKKSYIEYHKSI
jgi:SpoVK/Ycf46/Vps4 family AAA+-type ATPase